MVLVTASSTALVSELVTSISSVLVPTITTVPTITLVTITTQISTSHVVSTYIYVPSTIISVNVHPTPTTYVHDIDVFPLHSRLLAYFLFVLYGLFYAWFLGFTHVGVYNKATYAGFFMFSVINIIISGVATILSALPFDGNISAKVIWGEHFNVGSDVVTVMASIINVWAIGVETKWTRRHTAGAGGTADAARRLKDCRSLLLSVLVLVLAALGLLSSIASLYNASDTNFAKLGGWYVGMIFWITGSFLFVLGECEYIRDMCHGYCF
jgi:hypothetical protein